MGRWGRKPAFGSWAEDLGPAAAGPSEALPPWPAACSFGTVVASPLAGKADGALARLTAGQLQAEALLSPSALSV